MTNLLASALWAGAVFSPQPPAAFPTCRQATITGYVRTAPYLSAFTYDGTSIVTPEPIVAASRDVPLGSHLTVDGPLTEGTIYRVADRGSGLQPTHIDIAVWTVAAAYAITGRRWICWSVPR